MVSQCHAYQVISIVTIQWKCLIACATWKPGSQQIFLFLYQFKSSSINPNLFRTAVALDDSRTFYLLRKSLLSKNHKGKFTKWIRKQFLVYFQASEKSSSVNDDDVKVTKYVKSATGHASNAELNIAENEVIKSCQKKHEYQRNIPKNIKKEVDKYALILETQAPIKVFSKKYPTAAQFNQTSVNYFRIKVVQVPTMVITKRLVTEHARWCFVSVGKGYSLRYSYVWWRLNR